MKLRTILSHSFRITLTLAVCIGIASCGGSDSEGEGSSASDILSLGPNISEISSGYYAAGVSSAEFEFFASPSQGGRQRQENWCWAACIQMLLNYHGIDISQEELVQEVFGTQVDQPANADQIIYLIDDWIYQDIFGSYYYSEGTPYATMSSRQIIDLLARRWPIIVGLSNPNLGVGHAYLLTGVYFTIGSDGVAYIDTFILRDPWPESESRQEFSAEQFTSRFMFAATLELTPLDLNARIPADAKIVGHVREPTAAE